jgi:hypothetical protein
MSAAHLLAQMLLAGMTLMERIMTANGTRTEIIAPHMDINMKTLGTRRILHVVLVVVV